MTWLVLRCLPVEVTFGGELLGRVSGSVALGSEFMSIGKIGGVSICAGVGATVGCIDPLGWNTTVSLASGSYWPCRNQTGRIESHHSHAHDFGRPRSGWY